MMPFALHFFTGTQIESKIYGRKIKSTRLVMMCNEAQWSQLAIEAQDGSREWEAHTESSLSLSTLVCKLRLHGPVNNFIPNYTACFSFFTLPLSYIERARIKETGRPDIGHGPLSTLDHDRPKWKTG